MPLWDASARQIAQLPLATIFDAAADMVPFWDASLGLASQIALKEMRALEYFSAPMSPSLTGALNTVGPLKQAIRWPYDFMVTEVQLVVATAGSGCAIDVLNSTTSILDNTTTAGIILQISGSSVMAVMAPHSSKALINVNNIINFHLTAVGANIARQPRVNIVGYRV
jgi:hypothetical protein